MSVRIPDSTLPFKRSPKHVVMAITDILAHHRETEYIARNISDFDIDTIFLNNI
jgi:hypothetical protein